MSRRAWGALALLGCGVLLLAATQPWVRTVTEVAPGAPRSRGTVGGTDLVPWLAPVAVVTGVAVVAGLAGMRWARPLAPLAAVATVAGAVWGVVHVRSAAGLGAAVVSASGTPWLWVAAAAALLTGIGTVLWWWPSAPGRQGRPTEPARTEGHGCGGGAGRQGAGVEDPDGAEAERRRAAADWRDLTEGRDPTQEQHRTEKQD